MMPCRPTNPRGLAYVIALLALGFLVLAGRCQSSMFTRREQISVWGLVIAPWVMWFWWRYLRGPSQTAGWWRPKTATVRFTNRPIRWPLVVWTITAVLMLASIVAVRSPATPPTGPSTAAEAQDLAVRVKTIREDIAAKPLTTPPEFEESVQAHLPYGPAAAGRPYYRFVIATLQFDGLLILNLPLYGFLSLRFFGAWGTLYSTLSDRLIGWGKEEVDGRVALYFLLCGAVIAVEFALLRQWLG